MKVQIYRGGGAGAGEARGSWGEQQESRAALELPEGETDEAATRWAQSTRGGRARAPRAKCTVGPGLAKPVFPAALASLPSPAPRSPQKSPGLCTQRRGLTAAPPPPVLGGQPGSEGPP